MFTQSETRHSDGIAGSEINKKRVLPESFIQRSNESALHSNSLVISFSHYMKEGRQIDMKTSLHFE